MKFGVRKLEVVELPDGEEITTLAFFVLTQYRRVTDGWTERRTDGRTDTLLSQIPATRAGKNNSVQAISESGKIANNRVSKNFRKEAQLHYPIVFHPLSHPFLPSLPPSLPFSLSSRFLSTVLLISVSSFPSYPYAKRPL